MCWGARRTGAVSDAAVVGKVGDVLVRVRGGDAPGEIVTIVRGTRETFLAYAEDPIEAGSKVLVIGVRGPRSVDVLPWSE